MGTPSQSPDRGQVRGIEGIPTRYRYRLKSERSTGGRFAVGISLLSLAVAAFGTLFSVARAHVEDQSKLRTELTETDQRLAQATFGVRDSASVDEIRSNVAQMTQIIGRVTNVPAVYYRHLASAQKAVVLYADSSRSARTALALARARSDVLEEAIDYRILAGNAYAVGDVAQMRRSFAVGVRLGLAQRNRYLGVAARIEANRALADWAVNETVIGTCARARAALKRALALERTLPASQRAGSLKSLDTAVSTAKACGLSTH